MVLSGVKKPAINYQQHAFYVDLRRSSETLCFLVFAIFISEKVQEAQVHMFTSKSHSYLLFWALAVNKIRIKHTLHTIPIKVVIAPKAFDKISVNNCISYKEYNIFHNITGLTYNICKIFINKYYKKKKPTIVDNTKSYTFECALKDKTCDKFS